MVHEHTVITESSPAPGEIALTDPEPAGVAHTAAGESGAVCGRRGVARSTAPATAVVPAPPSASAGTPVARGWPVGDYLAFAPNPCAAQCARLHAKNLAWEWGLARLTEALEHIVDELVANALAASATVPGTCPVRVWLLTDHHAVLVLVWDASPRPPQPARPGLLAEHGRGLLLVEHFSAEWNWYRTPVTGGKMTWALISQ